MKNRMKRLLSSVAWGGLGILLLVVLLRAATPQVLARQDVDPPPRQENKVIAQSVSDWQTVISDTFDGTFTTTYKISRQAITDTGSANYSWGRVITSSTGFTDTMWCVREGDGALLDVDTATYTNGVTTTLTYGPIGFRNVLTAELSFQHWISVASGDGLEWGYSTDGTSFTFTTVPSSTVVQWYTTTLDSWTAGELDSLPGKPRVYLAFRFRSDNDQVDRGVFLDNVQLRVRYDTTQYFPLIFKDHFVSYSDHFDDATSGWPTWRRLTYNSDGSESENNRGGYILGESRAQFYEELMDAARPPGVYEEVLDNGARAVYVKREGESLGIPSDIGSAADKNIFYEVVRDDGDEVFVTGPVQVPSNFVYEAWARYSWMAITRFGNEIGILITTDPVNPSDPHTVRGYSFQTQFNISTDGDLAKSKFALKRWNRVNWGGGAVTILGYLQDDSYYFNRTIGDWNKFTIVRYGSTIEVYVNDHYIGTVNDGTFTGKMYVGFFTAHTRDASYDIMFEFDDVSVLPYP